MIFFKDPIDYRASFRITSAESSQFINIRHDICYEDSENCILIMSNPELHPYLLNDPSVFAETPPLRLSLDQGHYLSELLPYACAKFDLETSLDFILNYQDILQERQQEWTICAADVYPDCVYLYYVNSAHDAMGEICLEKFPYQLRLEVPEPLPSTAPEDGRKLTDRIFGRNRSSESDCSCTSIQIAQKTTVVIAASSDGEAMTIWTGDLRLGKLQSEPLSGQRMLRLAYDSDDDFKIERIYPRRDLSRDELEKLLNYVAGEDYFVL